MNEISVGPLRVRSKVEQTRLRLHALIRRKLAPGQKLPTVRELERQLQISRTTLFSALSGLVTEGHLIARHGAGYYVADWSKTESHRGAVAMMYPAATPRGEGLPYNYQMSILLETIQRRCPDVRFRLLPITAGQFLPASEELVDSLAVIADALPPADILRLADMGRPVIVPATTRPIDHAHVYSVMLDMEHVMRDMLIRFKEAGHKQVGLIAYADHMPDMFRTIHCSLFHTPVRCIQLPHPDPTEPTACVYDPIALAFTEHKSCTAWLAVDEFITNRLVRECVNHHLRIPENISLASLFYSNKHFNIATVPIACVDVFEHAQRLGEQVGDIVAHILNGKASRRHQYALDPAIQWGESIGSPKKTIPS